MTANVREIAPQSGGREEETEPRQRRRTGRWILIAALVLGYVANVVWRLWLGHPLQTPSGHADEDSYLNVARALAGGPGGFSSETQVFRRVGYSLFMTPAFLFGLEFHDSYRFVQVLNALVNALTLPLAYLVGRRVFRLSRWPAYAGAMAAVTLPATVFWSLVAMTDALMAALFLTWVLALHWWFTSLGRRLPTIAAGTATALLFLVHIRGTIFGALFGLLLLYLVARRRIAWKQFWYAVLPLAVAVVFTLVVVLWLRDRVQVGSHIVGGGTLEVFTDGRRFGVFLYTILTDLWYLCFVSAGLAGVAVTVTVLRLRDRSREMAYRWTTGMALLATMAVTGGSAVIMAGLNVGADAIYTRYVQMFVPFWVLAGFAVLLSVKLPRALGYALLPVVVLAVAGPVLALRYSLAVKHGHPLMYGAFGGPDVISITRSWAHFRPVLGSVIGLAGLVVLLALTRARRLAIPAMALFLLANIVTMSVMRTHIIGPLAKSNNPVPLISALGVTSADRVEMTWGLSNQAYFAFFHAVSWQKLKSTEVPKRDTDVVLARWLPGKPKDWDGTKYGFHRVGGNEGQGWAVWRRN